MADSCCALFNLTFDFSLPAVKIGCVTCEPNPQTLPAPVNKLDSAVLSPPKKPLSEIRGKYAARAASTLKFVATRVCSAERMSGRRFNKSDGRPGGTVGMSP